MLDATTWACVWPAAELSNRWSLCFDEFVLVLYSPLLPLSSTRHHHCVTVSISHLNIKHLNFSWSSSKRVLQETAKSMCASSSQVLKAKWTMTFQSFCSSFLKEPLPLWPSWSCPRIPLAMHTSNQTRSRARRRRMGSWTAAATRSYWHNLCNFPFRSICTFFSFGRLKSFVPSPHNLRSQTDCRAQIISADQGECRK